MVKVEGAAIGIDLGTVYCCAGVWQKDRVVMINDERGNHFFGPFSDTSIQGDITVMLLIKTRETAEAFLVTPVKYAVITVPTYFDASQRQATRSAGVLSGFHKVTVINDSTAAAIAYGVHRKPTCARDTTVLIFDLEGTTLHVSVVTFKDDQFLVKATSGHSHLGGMDSDKTDLLFRKCIDIVDDCLTNAKMDKSMIHDVVLVGESTRIQQVQQLLQEFLQEVEIWKIISPDMVAAYGATVQAALLYGNDETQELPLLIDETSSETWEGMDYADLPVDEGSPLRQIEDMEMAYESTDELEKACSERIMATTSTTPIFSKVYPIGNGAGNPIVAIPKGHMLDDGSPSKLLQTQPGLLKTAINASFRVQVCFKDGRGNHVSYGTGFLVSPCVILTAKHVVEKTSAQIKAYGGISVLAQFFETDAAMGATEVNFTRRGSKTKDSNGLFTKGADVGCFKVQDSFSDFLLPCSPTFLSSNILATISFPAIDNVLKRAKHELLKGKTGKTSIWDQYLLAMQPTYQNTLSKHAAATGMRIAKIKNLEPIMKAVHTEVKQKLFTELSKTFGVARTGGMVCSVGHMICSNKMFIGTSCSTLAGSSGAPIVPLTVCDHFVGVQKGGCKGYDMNCATSTDNEDFVELYMANVLPTLPPPEDSFWTHRRSDGFYHWLCLHGPQVPNLSPWCGKISDLKKRQQKRKALWP